VDDGARAGRNFGRQPRVVEEGEDGVEVLIARSHELPHLLGRAEAAVFRAARVGHGAYRVLESARVLRVEEHGDPQLVRRRRRSDATPESEPARDVPLQLESTHRRRDYRRDS